MKQLILLLSIFIGLFPQTISAQSDNPALDAEAQKVLAEMFFTKEDSFSQAIENMRTRKFFRFTQLDKGETLAIPLAKFYARELSADASPQEISEAAINLMKLGYNAEADKYFEIYLRKNTTDAFYYNERADNAMLAENYRACVDYTRTAFSKDKKDFWANSINFTLAICSAELGDNKTAKKAFDSLNNHLKNSFHYRLFQDNAYKCTGTADDNYASASYSFIKGNTYPAFRDAFIATKCDPNHLPSLEILQKIAASADEKTDPLHDWANPLKMKIMRLKNHPIPPPFGLSEEERTEFFKYFSAKFQKAFDKQDFEWAILYATEIALGFPEKSEGYTMRARTFISQEKHKNLQLVAWLDASKAIQINPQDALAYNTRGLVYLNIKRDFPAAIKEFNKGIAANPNEFRLYANRGIAFYNLKELKAAYNDFDRSFILNPKNFDSIRFKGFVAMELKDYLNAIPALEKALELAAPTGNVNRWIQKNLVIAYDAIGNKIMGDSYHQKLLDCCFDNEETKSLQARNPKLVADWTLIENTKKQNDKLEIENIQRNNEKNFLALVKWDTENAESTNASIKRQIDYGNGIKQSPRVTISGIIRSLDIAIEGRKKRIAELESYLIGDRLPPQNLAKARNLVEEIKGIQQQHEASRRKYQNDLRNIP